MSCVLQLFPVSNHGIRMNSIKFTGEKTLENLIVVFLVWFQGGNEWNTVCFKNKIQAIGRRNGWC